MRRSLPTGQCSPRRDAPQFSLEAAHPLEFGSYSRTRPRRHSRPSRLEYFNSSMAIRRVNKPLAPKARRAYLAKSTARDREVVLIVLFILIFVMPIVASTVLYLVRDRIADWRSADRSSAGLLPPALAETGAAVRIFSARTVRWRGIVASHSWIVIKEAGAPRYSRFDYTAWGEPIWIDRFVPDGRWFGRTPELIFAADGSKAEQMIPRIREAIRSLPIRTLGTIALGRGQTQTPLLPRSSARSPVCSQPFRLLLSGKTSPLTVVGLA